MSIDTDIYHEIRVSVSGFDGSGKGKLVDKLNGYTFTRDIDRKSFRLLVNENVESSPATPFEYDFAIFTFSLEHEMGIPHMMKWSKIRDSIRAQHPNHQSRICLVGTKWDLVTKDFSPHDMNVRCLPHTILFFTGFDYVPTSAITGEGIDRLASLLAGKLNPLPPDTPPLNVRGMIWDVLGITGNKILDVIASIFALPVPVILNQDTEDPISIPDDDAVEPLWKSPESMEYNKHLAGFTGFWQLSSGYRISPTLFAKPLTAVEWASTMFARSHLKIPIPQPRYPHLRHWFVQDFVKGKMLLECWETLGIFMQFRIACTLRGYLLQLRQFRRPVPGSIQGGHVFGSLFAPGFYNGPFESSLTFQRWVKEVTWKGWGREVVIFVMAQHDGRIDSKEPIPEEPQFPDHEEWPLVFTHGDLSLSNVMLSDDGTLWVVDWADSGFYPPWMEALGVYRYENHPQSWKRLRWIVVGPTPLQQKNWKYFSNICEGYGSMEPREGTWPP